jgi:hypothetical protein
MVKAQISALLARKPFDVLAENRLLEVSGEDRTAIELFIAGVIGSEVELRHFLDTSADGK